MEKKTVNSEELYRMWGESTVNITQEFTDTVKYLIDMIVDKYYNGIPGIENMKSPTLSKVMVFLNKTKGSQPERTHGYFTTIIKSCLIGMIYERNKKKNN